MSGQVGGRCGAGALRHVGAKRLVQTVVTSTLLLLSGRAAAGGIDFGSQTATGPGGSSETPDATASPPAREALGLEAGARVAVMPNAGLDPYSTSDLMPQLSLGASLALWQRGALSLSIRGGWDFGESSAMARSAHASMALHRLSFGGEASVTPLPWLAVFVRAAPAALHVRGTLEDASDPQPLHARSWTWGLDASAGAALRFARLGTGSSLWLIAEGGYGFAGEADMEFVPVEEDDDARGTGTASPTVLPGARPAGAMSRLALALRF